MVDETALDRLFERGSVFFAPSDELPELRQMASHLSIPKSSDEIPGRIRVVVDANTILADLLWMERKRQNKNASTGLLEAMDSGIIEVYTPEWIKKELKKKLLEFANKYSLDHANLDKNWLEIQHKIIFCTPNKQLVKKHSCKGDDKKDAPYIALAEEMGGVPIISADTDIQRMGGKALHPLSFIPKLRESARSMAVWLHCKIQMHLLIFLALSLTIGLATMARKLFIRMPGWLRIISLVLIALVIWIYWKRLSDSFKRNKDKLKTLKRDFLDFIYGVGIRLIDHQNIAQKHLALVEAEISKQQL